MASFTFPNPTEVAEEYLQRLKGLKPEVNIDQTDNDWFIRARVLGGVMSGLYADQRRIADDAFPQNSRREATEKHLNLYFDAGFNPAQQADGIAKVTGATGSFMPAGTQMVHVPTGNTYATTEDETLAAASGGSGLVPVQSLNTGQDQNLLAGAELTVSSPPFGFDPSAEVYSSIGNGRDEESNEEARARILNRVRFPSSGGTEADYRTWTLDADPSVSDVNILRFFRGLGTVGVAFTAGTTNIDEAIDNNEDIVKIPSDALIEQVAEYIDARNPLTDCLFMIKPGEIPIDVTARVRFASGDGDTVLSGQTLSQKDLVEREIKRAIHKTPLGGRRFRGAASGYVVASEIEETIDFNLSSEGITVGAVAQILLDRQIDNLSATGANRLVDPTQVAIPGVITVIEQED